MLEHLLKGKSKQSGACMIKVPCEACCPQKRKKSWVENFDGKICYCFYFNLFEKKGLKDFKSRSNSLILKLFNKDDKYPIKSLTNLKYDLSKS